jgi:hypothetical protein
MTQQLLPMQTHDHDEGGEAGSLPELLIYRKAGSNCKLEHSNLHFIHAFHTESTSCDIAKAAPVSDLGVDSSCNTAVTSLFPPGVHLVLMQPGSPPVAVNGKTCCIVPGTLQVPPAHGTPLPLPAAAACMPAFLLVASGCCLSCLPGCCP